mmetsp:Transcript_3585/g.13058  ORF Transcript_3585/g.13058 Transcript_3585/m.13058 type:complete len:246 (-) Transcript_3585:1156-1893(-)
MVSTVDASNATRIMRWILASVLVSMFAVASSMTSTFGERSSARAMQMSCRSPTLRLPPPSATLSSSDVKASVNCALRTASHTRSSSNSSNGSRLYRTVPVNSTGSCGIMPILERRSFRPMLAMSTPSMTILPAAASTMRNRPTISELLPAPVRPTTPIFSCAPISHVIDLSTSGLSGRYRSEYSRKATTPSLGHDGGGLASSSSKGASGAVCVAYSCTRSTELICASAAATASTTPCSACDMATA